MPNYLQDFTRFGYITGWRKSDIASLLWVDVDGDVIRLRPESSKHNQARSIPLRDSEGKLTEVGELVENRRRARNFESDRGPGFASHVFHHDGQPSETYGRRGRLPAGASGSSGNYFTISAAPRCAT